MTKKKSKPEKVEVKSKPLTIEEFILKFRNKNVSKTNKLKNNE